tara:strand:- start:4351 stop:4941 length:591 start_codon:yes stop_codon:yes gene_type:complete
MNLDINKYKYTQTWFLGSEIQNNLLKYIDKDLQYNILEIGSFEGLSACAFSDNLLEHDMSTLDCVDPYILSGTNDKITTKLVTLQTEKLFTLNINNSKYPKKVTHHKLLSDEFFMNNNKQFNLIYIDGCHEPEFILNDMNNSFSVLKSGGIMWMDDYEKKSKNNQCKTTMNKFLTDNIGKYSIIHKNYQLAIKKID